MHNQILAFIRQTVKAKRGLSEGQAGGTDAARRFPITLGRLFGSSKASSVAVCVPPGARLLLGDIPDEVQNALNVGPTGEVTFTQLTANPNAYRDAVRFKNGRELLLLRLREGQSVKVLEISWGSEPSQAARRATRIIPLAKSGPTFRCV